MKLADAISVAVRICMRAALDEAKGNVSEAAVRIGVNRTQFYKLATKHGMQLREKPLPLVFVPPLTNWGQP